MRHRENLVGARSGHNAARAEFTVLYQRLPRLFGGLAIAPWRCRYPRLFRSICRTQLLILDDWGPDPMTAKQRRGLLEIVEGRYGGASTLLIGQQRFSRWHDVIGKPTLPTVKGTRRRAGHLCGVRGRATTSGSVSV